MLRLRTKGITSIIAAIGLLCLAVLMMPSDALAKADYQTADGTNPADFSTAPSTTDNYINQFTAVYSGSCSNPATSFTLTPSNSAVISAVRIEDTVNCTGTTLSTCTGGGPYTCNGSFAPATFYVCVDTSASTGSTTLTLTNVTPGAGCAWAVGSADTSATMTVTVPNLRPTVASLTQKNSASTTITPGGYSDGPVRDTVIFGATISDNESDNVRLNVEYRTSPATWTAANCTEAGFSAPGVHSVTCTGIPDGIYDWRASANDAGGTGTWVQFGSGNNDQDFKIDNNAPAAVADLAAPSSTTNSVTLTWSNPSDGSGSGNAIFDVRYRLGSTFVEADWAAASQATGEPTPPTTGMSVGSLTCGQTYAFAIKTTDNVGLTSTISNAATRATAACPGDIVTADTFTSVAPGSSNAGTNNVQMLYYKVYVSTVNADGVATLTDIKVRDLGTAPTTDVPSNIQVYKSNNTSCCGGDTLIGSGTGYGSGNPLSINITDQSVDTTGFYIFILYDISASAGNGNTLQTNIADNTYLTVSGTDSVSTAGGSSSSMSIVGVVPDTVTIAGGTNNAPANVSQGDQNVKMLTFNLTTDSTDDGTMNFTALKVDRTGTGADSDVSAVKAYWSADATCNTSDTQLGATSTFGSGTVTFSGFSQAINTTTSYVCVFFSIDPAASTGVTVGASVADQTYVTVSESKNAWGGISSTNSNIQVAVSCDKTITSCTECHGDAGVPTMAPSDGTRDWSTGSVVGDHRVGSHVPSASPTEGDCAMCHAVPSGNLKHRDGLIEMNATGIKGGTYSRGTSFAQTTNPTTGNCLNTSCHGASSPQWGVGKVNCDSCHAASTGGSFSLAGAHSLHYNSTALPTDRTAVNKSITNSTTYMFNCGYCHDVDPTSEHLDTNQNTGNSVDVIFNIAMSPWTSGTYTSGVNNTTGNPSNSGFRWWYDGSCGNVYCHSNVQSNIDGISPPNVYGTPSWGQTGPLGCAACHGSPPSSGSHTPHNSAGFTDCTTCHKEFVYGQPAHVNGVIDVVINTTVYGASATYSQGKNAPGTGYGTCSNNTCHDNGRGTLLNTPTWGVNVANCAECHPTQPTTGSHQAHLSFSSGLTIVCGNCHDSAVQGSSYPAQHLDGNVDVYDAANGDLGYPANKTKNTAYSTCNNAYCHDNGRTGKVTSPTWGTSPAQCSECHLVQPTTGSHTKHLGSGASCSNCHDSAQQGSVYPTQHLDGNIDVYDVADGDLGYTPNKTKNTAFRTCNNAYCHDNGRGTKVTTPTWGTTGGCGACHQTVPSTGSHSAHLGFTGGLTIVCGNCHDSVVQGSSAIAGQHTDGNIDVYDVTFGDLGYPSNKAKNSAYTTCNNAWCHENGRLTKVTSPTWGTPNNDCSACHPTQPTSGSHQAHLNTSKMPTAPNCGDCHDSAQQGSVAPTQHLDGNVDVYKGSNGDLGYPANKTKNTAFSTCNNAYCHDNGRTGKVTTPTWGTNPAECSECHLVQPTTGSHTKHLNGGASCSNCHDGAVQGSSVPGVNHLDGDIDVFDIAPGDLGYTPNKAKNTAFRPCTNASCHDNGTGTKVATPTWGTSPAACSACHPQQPTTGSHTAHLNYTNVGCGNCHDSAVKAVSAIAGQHVDGNIDVYDVTFGDLGYPSNKAKNSAYQRCSNLNCHGSFSPTWGTTITRYVCTTCHGDTAAGSSVAAEYQMAPPNDTSGASSATDPDVGAHQIHLRSASSTAPIVTFNITCNTCHNKPASVFASGHIDSALPAEVSFGSLATANGSNPSWNGTTCSNVYCHDEAHFTATNHANNAPGTTPSWGDTTYESGSNPRTKATTPAKSDCGECHAYDGTDCQGCHPHVNSTNNGFDSDGGGLADHMNGTVESSGGTCTGCHSGVPTGTAPQYVSRNVMGSDFTMASRHVWGATPTIYECTVCHLEGLTDGSWNSGSDPGKHDTDATKTVSLRNVDSIATGWEWDKTAVTNAMLTNLDTFCLACHDSNGANGIAVALGGGSITTNPTATTIPATNRTLNFAPFNDALRTASTKAGSSDDTTASNLTAWGKKAVNYLGTQAVCQAAGFRWTGSACMAERSSVVDIKSKASSTVASHAIVALGSSRYGTNNANWTGWVTKTLKDGSALATVKEKAVMHCADCHTVDANAHGSNTVFMLTASSVDNNCWQCHSNTVYNSASWGTGAPSNEAGSRFPHGQGDPNIGAADNTKINGSHCLLCHGGAPQKIGMGGIHGIPTSTNDYRFAQISYRFIGGAYMVHDGQTWTNTAAASTCYFDATDTAPPFSNCSHHSGNTGSPKGSPGSGLVLQYGRATKY